VAGRSIRFEHATAGENAEVEIPASASFLDYRRRLVEVVEVIAEVEGVEAEDVILSLSVPPSDVIRFRYVGESVKDGTLSLDDAIRIRSARRQLFLAAAHSAVAPLPYFARLTRSEPIAFIADCREAPPRPGSFISEVIVPVSQAIGGEDLEPPFARRTTDLLARALLRTSDALERGDDDSLLKGTQDGLSSNLLGALAELTPPGGRGALEILFRWEPTRAAPEALRRPIHLGAHLFAPLQEVARVLRETSEAPGCELEGFVARAERADPEDLEQPGEVVLVTTVDGRPGTSRVHLTLAPEVYRQAVDAHKHAARVRVTGTLVRTGRRLTLHDAGGFVVESDEA